MARVQKCQHRAQKPAPFCPRRHLHLHIERLPRRIHEPIHPHHSDTLVRQLRQHHPLELEDNDTKMRATWDPNSPFDCLIKQIERLHQRWRPTIHR